MLFAVFAEDLILLVARANAEALEAAPQRKFRLVVFELDIVMSSYFAILARAASEGK